ncbi:MAG: CDP-alcohol phosphatidyltransferase family protein [Burkholderiaceae bacterium]
MTDRRSLQPALSRWNAAHAVTMIMVAMVVAAGLPPWLACVAGALSFAVLVWCCRGRWTPGGRFGPANAITMARLYGMFALPFMPPLPLAVAGTILLALDGVDGWVARRTGTSGEFGAFLDQECDAFFLLLLCLMLYRLPGGPGAWILLPGLLRYLFVLFVGIAKPPRRKEPRSRHAIVIFVVMMATLLLCFAAHPDRLDTAVALAAVASLALAWSFGDSLHRMYRGPAP